METPVCVNLVLTCLLLEKIYVNFKSKIILSVTFQKTNYKTITKLQNLFKLFD